MRYGVAAPLYANSTRRRISAEIVADPANDIRVIFFLPRYFWINGENSMPGTNPTAIRVGIIPRRLPPREPPIMYAQT